MTIAYRQGQRAALEKLGFVARTLGGAALGGLAGYALAPEDRKAVGVGSGALLAALGAAGGPALAKAVGGQELSALEHAGSAALAGTAGVGLSQFATGKEVPHHSEDPYRYLR